MMSRSSTTQLIAAMLLLTAQASFSTAHVTTTVHTAKAQGQAAAEADARMTAVVTAIKGCSLVSV